jgi:flagellar biosynthesis chaperone FliJ
LLEVDTIYDQIQNYEQLILKERKKDSVNLQNEYKQVGDVKKELEKQLVDVNKSYDMLRFKMEAHVSIYTSRLANRITQLQTDISDRKEKLASDQKEQDAKAKKK